MASSEVMPGNEVPAEPPTETAKDADPSPSSEDRPDDAAGGDQLVLVCTFPSGENKNVVVAPGMALQELREELARGQQVPVGRIRVATSAGAALMDKTILLKDSCADGKALVFISPPDFVTGDRICAQFNSGATADGASFEAGLYKGTIEAVRTEDGISRYDILWDDQTKSENIYCEGAIWRTGAGSVISVLEKDAVPPAGEPSQTPADNAVPDEGKVQQITLAPQRPQIVETTAQPSPTALGNNIEPNRNSRGQADLEGGPIHVPQIEQVFLEQKQQVDMRLKIAFAVFICFFGVFAIIYFVAYATASPECPSKPLRLKDFFLGIAVFHIVIMCGMFVSLLVARKMNSAGGPGQREPPACVGILLPLIFCGSCCWILVWSILGLISAIDSGDEDVCSTGRTWYWVLFVVGFVCNGCSSSQGRKMTSNAQGGAVLKE